MAESSVFWIGGQAVPKLRRAIERERTYISSGNQRSQWKSLSEIDTVL